MTEDLAESKIENKQASKSAALVRALLAENAAVPHKVLSKVFNVPLETVEKIEFSMHKLFSFCFAWQEEIRNTEKISGSPLSWDYVMVFDTGDENKIRKATRKEKLEKPTYSEDEEEWERGMSQRKYFLQIILQTQRDLENARLSTKFFKFSIFYFFFFI
ncbi:hypothetical protein RFI_17556 [Reticulomyxa filosa]|uniref:Uncharacterized protein n=1 Tax=Reticulomyxa filosa TaxID=46433 RepID=X6N1R0_RETFI|nr:hypothetical protein RFI_17556 [Reticulomyxa filosa]|eukprot:ETO19674.1 hypothetical protein RFI_17556 [Reticulomyxa filosa]